MIDVSDPEMELKINTVNQILSDIGRTAERIIYVFNKVDKAIDFNKKSLEVTYSNHDPLFISTKTGEGVEEIKEVISQNLL